MKHNGAVRQIGSMSLLSMYNDAQGHLMASKNSAQDSINDTAIYGISTFS